MGNEYKKEQDLDEDDDSEITTAHLTFSFRDPGECPFGNAYLNPLPKWSSGFSGRLKIDSMFKTPLNDYKQIMSKGPLKDCYRPIIQGDEVANLIHMYPQVPGPAAPSDAPVLMDKAGDLVLSSPELASPEDVETALKKKATEEPITSSDSSEVGIGDDSQIDGAKQMIGPEVKNGIQMIGPDGEEFWAEEWAGGEWQIDGAEEWAGDEWQTDGADDWAGAEWQTDGADDWAGDEWQTDGTDDWADWDMEDNFVQTDFVTVQWQMPGQNVWWDDRPAGLLALS
jgi:hypothetical protein